MIYKTDKPQNNPDLVPLLIDTTCALKTYYKQEPKSPIKSQRRKAAKHDIPKRYVFALLGFLGMAFIYGMRVNLSVAVLAMVEGRRHKNASEGGSVLECPHLLQNVTLNQINLAQAPRYDWTEETVNTLLGSFYYGFVLTQIPGGYLSKRVSCKWLYASGVLAMALLTLATPLAAEYGVQALMVDRIFQGLAVGVTNPVVNAMISKWSARQERSRLSSFIFSGGLFGNVLTLPLAGWLSTSRIFGGWPAVFYLSGILSLIWLLFWIHLVYDSPLEHPSISEDELVYLEENQDTIHKNPKVPWIAIFTSVPMWAVVVSHFGSSLAFLTLFTALPTYLSSVLHFEIEADGYISALPFFFQGIGAWISAYAADRLREAELCPVTRIRKIFNTIGLLGPAATLLGVTASGCRPKLIVALICLTTALQGAVYSGHHVTHIDMSPDFAGVLFGISSTIADLNGIFGPALVTAFTGNEPSAENWNKVFYALCLGSSMSALFYLAFGSAELQPWGLDEGAVTIRASLSSEVDTFLK